MSSALLAEIRTQVRLAWPVTLGQLAGMSMSVVDTMMVGRVSAEAMAAVSLGSMWGFGISVFAFGMLRAIDPLVAQAHGAGDDAAVGRTLVRGLALALLLSVPSAALYLAAEPGLRLLGQPAGPLPDAGAYAAVLSLGVPAGLVFHVVRSVVQGRGSTRPAMVAIVLANLVNAAVDYVFIFGHFGAPALGVVGAALATVASGWFQLGLLVWLERVELRRLWRGVAQRFEPKPVGELARLGLPQGFQMASEVWSFLVAGFMVGSFGAVTLAGHTVVMQLSSVSFMVPLGVSTAAAIRVGQRVGAGLPWGHAAIAAQLLGAGAMSVSALLFAFLPGPLAAAFTTDLDAVAIAVALLPLAAAFQLFDGAQVVAFGVLRGAGDLTVPATANVVGYWLVGLPVGAWLAWGLDLGAAGVWAGLVVALASVAVLLVARERVILARGGTRLTLDRG